MPLNAQILLSILAHETSAGNLWKTIRVTPASYALSLTDGTGASQAQVAWSRSETIATPDDNFLSAGNLTIESDDRGIITISSVKVLYVKNAGTSGNFSFIAEGQFWFSQSGNSVFLKPGAAILLLAPDAAGLSGESVQLNIVGDVGATYEIVLIGEGTIS